MTPAIPLPAGAVEAANNAYADAVSARKSQSKSMEAAIQAFLVHCVENDTAEICENFVFSDDGEHNFGNGEMEDGSDDMPTVLILKLEEPQP